MTKEQSMTDNLFPRFSDGEYFRRYRAIRDGDG